jgi:hypothetical protein
MSQPNLITVSIFRRSYGRRYTDLPVESVDREALLISCEGTFMRPEYYDLRPGDIVRWRNGERYVEAVISEVRRDARSVNVALADAHPLPPEFFPY